MIQMRTVCNRGGGGGGLKIAYVINGRPLSALVQCRSELLHPTKSRSKSWSFTRSKA